jgi:hypothetical protein
MSQAHTGVIVDFEDGIGVIQSKEDTEATYLFFTEEEVAQSDWLSSVPPEVGMIVEYMLDDLQQIKAARVAQAYS